MNEIKLTLNKDVYRKSCQSYLQGLADEVHEKDIALTNSRHLIITDKFGFINKGDISECNREFERAKHKFYSEYVRIIKEFYDE